MTNVIKGSCFLFMLSALLSAAELRVADDHAGGYGPLVIAFSWVNTK
jgi:hypothetical protein